MTFKYLIETKDADEINIITTGDVDAADIFAALANAMRENFLKITEGKAVFGEPGKGCRGPYEVTKITLIKSLP